MSDSRRIAEERARWEKETRGPAVSRFPERKERFATTTGAEIPPIHDGSDRASDADDAHGYPGEYPFTRGVQATMYRGRLWTMRQ